MSEKENNARIAVIRVRGRVHVRGVIEDTLKLFNLTRKNHCVILDKTPEIMGMIHKVNDYVTWGEADPKTIEKLVAERARVIGGKKITDDAVKENSIYKSVKDFAKAVSEGKAKIKDFKTLKPVFRLNPPLKGFERAGIKKPFKTGGALGYRGEKINELIERML